MGKQISRDGTLYLTIGLRPASQLYTGKVVILIDELSASPEVVAGGLRIRKGYGNWTKICRQKLLSDKNIGQWRSFDCLADLLKPSGERFEESGVIPDIVNDRKIEDYRGNIDPSIQSALILIKY